MSVHGMLLLDKPTGISSNRALQICKRLVAAEKAGHTGSLDPLATGLLPLCFGKATRVTGMFLDADKSYQVLIRLGVHTETGDREGAVISVAKQKVDIEQVRQALESFKGEILQVPPMYSALKKHGQPLYKLARQGVEIKREPRKVKVHNLLLESLQDDLLNIAITCSKGFYVRSLAMDLGEVLGIGASVEQLRRTSVGRFSVEQAVTIDQLESLDSLQHRQNLIIPSDQALLHLPKINLSESSVKNFCQGQAVSVMQSPVMQSQDVGLARLYSANDVFLGLGTVTADGKVSPKRLFV